MLSSLFYWPQLALGAFVFFHSLLLFIVGNPAHITGFGSKPCQNIVKIFAKTLIKLFLLLFVSFLFYFLVYIAKVAPRRVQMQDTALMQRETPKTPAT